jgi:hypothetical protein
MNEGIFICYLGTYSKYSIENMIIDEKKANFCFKRIYSKPEEKN